MWEVGTVAQEEAGEIHQEPGCGAGSARQQDTGFSHETPEVGGGLGRGSLPGASSQPWDQVSWPLGSGATL